jgi:hypothetical protein
MREEPNGRPCPCTLRRCGGGYGKGGKGKGDRDGKGGKGVPPFGRKGGAITSEGWHTADRARQLGPEEFEELRRMIRGNSKGLQGVYKKQAQGR